MQADFDKISEQYSELEYTVSYASGFLYHRINSARLIITKDNHLTLHDLDQQGNKAVEKFRIPLRDITRVSVEMYSLVIYTPLKRYSVLFQTAEIIKKHRFNRFGAMSINATATPVRASLDHAVHELSKRNVPIETFASRPWTIIRKILLTIVSIFAGILAVSLLAAGLEGDLDSDTVIGFCIFLSPLLLLGFFLYRKK